MIGLSRTYPLTHFYMNTFDLWATERSKAERLPSGMLKLEGQNVAGQPTVMLWKPKAIKPFANYRFKDQSELHKYVYEMDQRISNHQKLVAERKAARKGTQEMIDAVSVGSIFHHSWGYDQTNADFYQVIAKNGRKVTIQQIAKKDVETQGHSMAGTCVPVQDSFKSEPMEKLLQFSGGKPFLKIDSYGWCDI